MGDAITKTIERFYDNSLENIGRGNSVSASAYRAGNRLIRAVDISWSNVGSSGDCSVPDVQR